MNKLIAFALLAIAPAASAGERKIARAEVPKPVLQAIEKHFPAAKQLGFEREEEHGKLIYEANLMDGTRRLDVDVAPDGSLLAVEETIKLEAAPDAVRKSLAASKYGKQTVTKAEKVSEYKADKVASVAYEFVVGAGERRVEVVIAESGKILKEEKKDDDDD